MIIRLVSLVILLLVIDLHREHLDTNFGLSYRTPPFMTHAKRPYLAQGCGNWCIAKTIVLAFRLSLEAWRSFCGHRAQPQQDIFWSRKSYYDVFVLTDNFGNKEPPLGLDDA